MKKPYVISAELDMPGSEVEPLIKNIERFREGLDADLRSLGKETLWLASSHLRGGLESLVEQTSLPIVSLDDRYVRNADQYLGISRGVNADMSDAGYQARAGYKNIDDQLRRVAELGSEVVIGDDVLFSGEMLAWLAMRLDAYDVKIGAVVCGVAINEGAEKLDSMGIVVDAVVNFGDVEDEICERDFAFVPGSGRRVAVLEANAAYFDNVYGRPAAWASIPLLEEAGFTARSLERNIALVNSDVAMSALGNFVGYGETGLAREQLQRRLKRAEEIV